MNRGNDMLVATGLSADLSVEALWAKSEASATADRGRNAPPTQL